VLATEVAHGLTCTFDFIAKLSSLSCPVVVEDVATLWLSVLLTPTDDPTASASWGVDDALADWGVNDALADWELDDAVADWGVDGAVAN